MILKNNIFMTILKVSNLSFGQGNIYIRQANTFIKCDWMKF